MVYKRILVPVDGSPASNAGLREALRLARAGKARLCLLNVMAEQMIFSSPEAALDMESIIESLRTGGRKVLKGAARTALDKGVKAQTALVESLGAAVSDTIVRHAKRSRADIIVMGTHARSGVKRLLMGSDAEGVVRRSGVPVLLVPERAARKKK